MGSIIGHRIDYNGVGALRGSGTYPAKINLSTPPPPRAVLTAQLLRDGHIKNRETDHCSEVAIVERSKQQWTHDPLGSKFYWVPGTYLFQLCIIFNFRKFRRWAIFSSPPVNNGYSIVLLYLTPVIMLSGTTARFLHFYIFKTSEAQQRKRCFITLPHNLA